MNTTDKLAEALRAIVGFANDDPRAGVVLPSQLVVAWEALRLYEQAKAATPAAASGDTK